MSLFFEVADQSFLPTLVEDEDLVEANSKLETSRSVAEIVGPGLAGGAIQILTAPVALVIDAFSFIVSAGFLLRLRTSEPEPEPTDEPVSLRAEIGEGLQTVLGNPALRAIAGWLALANLTFSMFTAVLMLYLSRELGLAPAIIGLIYAAASVGSCLPPSSPNASRTGSVLVAR